MTKSAPQQRIRLASTVSIGNYSAAFDVLGSTRKTPSRICALFVYNLGSRMA